MLGMACNRTPTPSITRHCKMANIALCYFNIIIQLSMNGDYTAALCSKINMILVLIIPLK